MANLYSEYGGRPLTIVQVDGDTTRTVTVGGRHLPVINILRRRGKRKHVDHTSDGDVTQRLGPILPSITATGELSPIEHVRYARELTTLDEMEERDLPVFLSTSFVASDIFVQTPPGVLGVPETIGGNVVRNLGTWEIDVFDIDDTDWLLGRAQKSRWTLKLVKL